MKKIRGTFLSIPVLLLANAPALWKLIDINSLLKTLIIILLALYTLVFMFKSHCELHRVQKIPQGSEK